MMVLEAVANTVAEGHRILGVTFYLTLTEGGEHRLELEESIPLGIAVGACELRVELVSAVEQFGQSGLVEEPSVPETAVLDVHLCQSEGAQPPAKAVVQLRTVELGVLIGVHHGPRVAAPAHLGCCVVDDVPFSIGALDGVEATERDKTSVDLAKRGKERLAETRGLDVGPLVHIGLRSDGRPRVEFPLKAWLASELCSDRRRMDGDGPGEGRVPGEGVHGFGLHEVLLLTDVKGLTYGFSDGVGGVVLVVALDLGL